MGLEPTGTRQLSPAHNSPNSPGTFALLLVSILEEIFKGNKHLFKCYYIYERLQWKKYPVIHLDFLGIDYESGGVEEGLIIRLDEIAAQYGLQLTGKSSKARFADLIKKLSAKEKERVVVLVDEYDKPIIDYVEKENLETAEENREKLRIFFSVLKHQDRNLKFLGRGRCSQLPAPQNP